MPRIPSLTSLRDSGLVLTAAAVTAFAAQELLADRIPSRRAGGGGKVPPLSAPLGWLYRVDELGGRIRPATAADVAAARAAAAIDGGDGVFGRGYATEEPLLPGSPGYSAAGVSYFRVIPTPIPAPISPTAGDRDRGQLQADVDQLRRAGERLRGTALRVRQVYGGDWIAGGDQDDDSIHVWSVPDALDPDEDAPRSILSASAGAETGAGAGVAGRPEVDPDDALALAEHVAGLPPAAALAIAALLDGEADALELHGCPSADGSTARARAVADACLPGSALDRPALQEPALQAPARIRTAAPAWVQA